MTLYFYLVGADAQGSCWQAAKLPNQLVQQQHPMQQLSHTCPRSWLTSVRGTCIIFSV